MILHDSRIIPVPLRRFHDMPASRISCTRPAPANRKCTRIPDSPHTTPHRSRHTHPQSTQHDETTAPSTIPRTRTTPANRRYAAIPHSPRTTPHRNHQPQPHLAHQSAIITLSPTTRVTPAPATLKYARISDFPRTTPRRNSQPRTHLAHLPYKSRYLGVPALSTVQKSGDSRLSSAHRPPHAAHARTPHTHLPHPTRNSQPVQPAHSPPPNPTGS